MAEFRLRSSACALRAPADNRSNFAGMPAATWGRGHTDIRQPHASPLRQGTAALAGKLPGQHGFLSASVGADDARTQVAMATVIGAGDLLFG